MQGSARKDVVFGATGVYPVTVPGPKWKSWIRPLWGSPAVCRDWLLTKIQGMDQPLATRVDSGRRKLAYLTISHYKILGGENLSDE